MPAGAVVVALLGALVASDPWPHQPLRRAWFDLYQQTAPRQPRSEPAVIVAVDEESLARYGQWPWPRNLMARLIEGILAREPVVVGLDLLFSEPGRLSPARLAELRPDLEPDLAARLRALESNDQILARAVGAGPVVLGMGAHDEGAAATGRLTPVREFGDPPLERLRGFAGLVRNLPLLEAEAAGNGLLNGDVGPDGVVRGVPLVARVDGRPVPGLALEMLRLAAGAHWYGLHGDGERIAGASVGDLNIPTAPDGVFRVHFRRFAPRRHVSAASVLDGGVAFERLHRKLVLVGVTGLGIVDHPPTPVAPRMPGVEVHAQVLENVFDATVLRRPRWAPAAEGAALAVLGLLLLAASLRRSPWPMVAVIAVGTTVLLAAGAYAYREALWLLDGATVTAWGWLLFVMALTANLGRSNAERRRLRSALRQERERALRTAGELEAAERIQMGILPAGTTDATDPRYELAVLLEPARSVGGDLYDFFMLDADHLFFVVGDVAGKGVPASLFMAITKTLWKSTALRLGHGVEGIITQANREVGRDNPEMMFVTALSGILDLESGQLDYCIAGHDPPLVVDRHGGVRHLSGTGGPPLCVMDDYSYPLEQTRLAAGDRLCLVTDGVTEAQDGTGALFGTARLEAAVVRGAAAGDRAADVLEGVRAEVAAFCGDTPAADDLTIMVLGWRGPPRA